MERVIVTRPILGICHMQVCAASDATDEEILEACNRLNPAGTSHGWAEVIRADITEGYWAGAKGPNPCAEIPGRTHFLVSC